MFNLHTTSSFIYQLCSRIVIPNSTLIFQRLYLSFFEPYFLIYKSHFACERNQKCRTKMVIWRHLFTASITIRTLWFEWLWNFLFVGRVLSNSLPNHVWTYNSWILGHPWSCRTCPIPASLQGNQLWRQKIPYLRFMAKRQIHVESRLPQPALLHWWQC